MMASKRHVVHALGQRGAEFLAEHDGVHFPAGKGFKTANELKSPERLEHRIGVVDAMLRFEQATASEPGLRVIHQDELLAVADFLPCFQARGSADQLGVLLRTVRRPCQL